MVTAVLETPKSYIEAQPWPLAALARLAAARKSPPPPPPKIPLTDGAA
eukprot:gene28963-9121_t